MCIKKLYNSYFNLFSRCTNLVLNILNYNFFYLLGVILGLLLLHYWEDRLLHIDYYCHDGWYILIFVVAGNLLAKVARTEDLGQGDLQEWLKTPTYFKSIHIRKLHHAISVPKFWEVTKIKYINHFWICFWMVRVGLILI